MSAAPRLDGLGQSLSRRVRPVVRDNVLAQISRAVFLSYASQDAEAARPFARRCAPRHRSVARSERVARRRCVGPEDPPADSGLRAVRAGDFGQLGVAAGGLLSSRMDARRSASQRIARSKSFIVPVSVDGTPLAAADVPDLRARAVDAVARRGDAAGVRAAGGEHCSAAASATPSPAGTSRALPPGSGPHPCGGAPVAVDRGCG